jgi:hypothetical protein
LERIEATAERNGDLVGNSGDLGGLIWPIWGENHFMQIRKVIQRRIRRTSDSVDFVGDVNAAISANVGERSSTSHVSSRSSVSAQSGRPRTEERPDRAGDNEQTKP